MAVDGTGLRSLYRKLRRAVAPPAPPPTGAGPDPWDMKGVNIDFVRTLMSEMPHDQAMEVAIGGGFELYGGIQMATLRHYGLPQDGYLIDVGCGSGRLARPLSKWLTGRYLGIDLVPELLAHARKLADRPDWRFELIDDIGIPEADGQADMVCFFSVLTHLLHEQSYLYLEEARRVLKPGGAIVFSFLEFAEPGHMPVFRATVKEARLRSRHPLNVFVDRAAIAAWAGELDMIVEEIRAGGDLIVPEGAQGQATCVLRKPA
jgi:ubiquinone/menaquinone biosynthesis C-methylase UbiE